MKINVIIYVVFILILQSCITPSYVPKHKKMNQNNYGAYIKIEKKRINSNKPNNNNLISRGELIAIDSNNNFIVLEKYSKKCLIVKNETIKKYNVKFAKSNNYFLYIPIITFAALIHESSPEFFLFSAPVNIVFSSIVAINGVNAYKLSSKKSTIEEIRKYARYPQGISYQLELDGIKSHNKKWFEF
jgi:hypothetical protein